MTVSDGDTACDKSKSFAVKCPVYRLRYEQDFEALDPGDPDALASDGWLYFGNVFDGTGAFKFDFGPFPAPTTTGQISAIATDQGGPDQGANQLVVFSNYDCCDPTEPRPLQRDRPGRDHRLPGDQSDPRQRYWPDVHVRVRRQTRQHRRLDDRTSVHPDAGPDAGFATTNNVVLDTTNLPASWATYSITLDLSDSALVGQILQFGFSTVASNFEGAGNFYDNISFCAPGGGGGGPGSSAAPAGDLHDG